MTSLQNPSYRDPSRLREAYTTGRTLDQNDWSALSRDNLETKRITIKPKTASHMTEFSRFPLPSCSLPRHPSRIKSLALSLYVSSWIIHFQVLDKSPFSGLEGVPLPGTVFLSFP